MIQVGPKGGRYYLGPSGGKVYLSRQRRTAKTRAEGDEPAGAPIDADGDGKINEEEKEDARLLRARAKVGKALAKHEAKQAQFAELQARHAAATARLEELASEDLDRETGRPKGRVAAAEIARNDAETAHETAVEERDNDRQALADLDAATPEQLEQKNWIDPSNAPIDGHEARKLVERDMPGLEARVTETDAARAGAKAEYVAARKEMRAAERESDKLESKIDNFDDEQDNVNTAVDEYVDTHDEVTAGWEEKVSEYDQEIETLKDDREQQLEAYDEDIADLKERRDADDDTTDADVAEAEALRANTAAEFDESIADSEAKKAPIAERLTKAQAERKSLGEVIDKRDEIDDEGEQTTPTKDIAKAIQVGPKGGRYVLLPSGKKDYI